MSNLTLISSMKKNWLLAFLAGALIVAIAIACFVSTIYFTAFGSNLTLNSTRTDWGVMGDFFGGILNPFLSFLGLVMLLVTLYQNQKELELSRFELSESSRALKEQAVTLEKQRFEGTFFSLLEQLNRVLEKVSAEGVRYDFENRPIKSESTVEMLNIFFLGGCNLYQESSIKMLKDYKKTLLGFSPILNQYFRILYQVLKLVATNSPGSNLRNGFSASALENTEASDTEKFYSNLARSCVPENVYYLLAVNCYTEGVADTYYPYKLLVERYEFFEHMPLIIPKNQNSNLISQFAAHYKRQAFGKNPEYVELFN